MGILERPKRKHDTQMRMACAQRLPRNAEAELTQRAITSRLTVISRGCLQRNLLPFAKAATVHLPYDFAKQEKT